MTKEELHQLIGKKLTELREELDISQNSVAKEAGHSSGYLSRVESGGLSITIWKLYTTLKVLKSKPSKFLKSIGL